MFFCVKNNLLSYSILYEKEMADAKKNCELNSTKRGYVESWKATYNVHWRYIWER